MKFILAILAMLINTATFAQYGSPILGPSYGGGSNEASRRAEDQRQAEYARQRDRDEQQRRDAQRQREEDQRRFDDQQRSRNRY